MNRTSTTVWKRIVRQVRAEGRASDTPCALCRGALGPIDYRTQGEADKEARLSGAWWEVGQPRPLALDVDHVVPHSQGGADAIENAQPTHAICNRQAQDKTPARAKTPHPRRPAIRVPGQWVPIDGRGDNYDGHDVPGRRTTTHVFVATG